MSTLARVTQQYAEALAQNPSDARVTQQYVEVLLYLGAVIIPQSVNSELNLTDNALCSNVFGVVDTLGLTDNVSFQSSLSLSTNSTLGLSDTALRRRTLSFVMETPIAFNTEPERENAVPVSANSNMSLSQAVGGTKPFDLTSNFELEHQTAFYYFVSSAWKLTDSLNLTSIASFEVPGHYYLNDTLNIDDEVISASPIRILSHHNLLLTHVASGFFGVRNFSVSSSLNLKSGLPLNPSLTSTLNLTDEAVRRWWPKSPISFSQTAIAGKSKSVDTGELDLTHSVNTNSFFIRDVVSDLGVSDYLTYYNENIHCVTKTYSPFLGGKTNPVPPTLPDEKRDATVNRVILGWPNIENPNSSIVLRAPEIDNIYRYSISRAYTETKGGSIQVYRNANWPKYMSLIVTFIGMSKEDAIAFQDFVFETIGSEIELADWHGNIWRGVITNPEEPIVCDGKRGYTISFQFDGTQQTSELTFSALDLSDSVMFDHVRGLFDTCGLTDELACNIIYVVPLTQEMELIDVSSSSTS